MRTLILAAVSSLFVTVTVSAQPKPGVDPCSLLTKADLKAATGLDTPGGSLNKSNATVCDYVVGADGVVGLSVPPPGGTTADTMIAELNKRKIKTENAAGVGDRAFFAAMGYGMIQLNAFKGRNYVIVTLMLPGAGEAKTKAAAVALMNKALAKF